MATLPSQSEDEGYEDDDDDLMQVEVGSVQSEMGVNKNEVRAADTLDDADDSDSDFDVDGGSESGQLIDDEEESVFLGPECPEVVPESGREDAEGIDQIEEEGPEILLHGDDGYEEDGTKNNGYSFWRGIEYEPATRKFRWDPDDSDHREVPGTEGK